MSWLLRFAKWASTMTSLLFRGLGSGAREPLDDRVELRRGATEGEPTDLDHGTPALCGACTDPHSATPYEGGGDDAEDRGDAGRQRGHPAGIVVDLHGDVLPVAVEGDRPGAARQLLGLPD